MSNKVIFKCKCHNRPYTVCPVCEHQYCTTYWANCPRCAEEYLDGPQITPDTRKLHGDY